MEGLYFYCIRKRSGIPSLLARGIDGKGEVFIFPYHELEAVVSKVSLEEFSSDEIQKKAREDLSWIKEKAIIHEKVIEEAMKRNEGISSIIPMKFGIVLKEKEGLEQVLNENYERFKTILEKIEGKQEWSVKVYLKNREKFEQEIKEKSEAIRKKEKEIASLPEGMAYFMEEELKEVTSREAEKELNNIVDFTFESLKKQAADSAICKILEKELTGRPEPMVLNAAYLISEEKIEDFKREIEDLNQKMQAKGLSVEYSGPWPPYNFV
ncbi:MAG: GvpL/GvpF family gas vesicle protein [Nitrospirae bacterium]|nr:GvpL/GvpF family gas vesicle protein [Nitrospirota bacterium]